MLGTTHLLYACLPLYEALEEDRTAPSLRLAHLSAKDSTALRYSSSNGFGKPVSPADCQRTIWRSKPKDWQNLHRRHV
jgi:hypothetical protein